MHINQLGLRQVRYFVAVAEELHFGHAARKLHISQPPLSQQIKALEELLGVALFSRTNRTVALTEAGKYLLEEARRLLRGLDRAAEHTRLIGLGAVGRIRIGVHFSVPLHPFVGPMLQRFREANPQVRLEIVPHDQFDQLELMAVEGGSLDMALLWLSHAHRGEVRRFDLVHEPLCAFVPAGHPLAARRSLAPDDLAEAPLVGPLRGRRSHLYETMLAFFGSPAFENQILYEGSHMPIILTMVAAGQGIALLPSFFARFNLQGVVALPLAIDTRPAPTMILQLAARNAPHDVVYENFIRNAEACATTYRSDVP